MKTALLFTLPLLAATCLADNLPPAGAHALPKPTAAPAEEQAFVYDDSYRSTEMDRILLFVCDEASADAAAEQGREIETSLGCKIHQIGNGPCLSRLSFVLYRVIFYELSGAVKPAYYGSEQLQALLTLEHTEQESETP